MLSVSEPHMHVHVLARPEQLAVDIENHLEEFRPQLFTLYPRPYLRWAIRDSVEQAQAFRFDDVYAFRLFVRLRFDVAPTFYLQPDIAAVLQRTDMGAMERFEQLATDHYAEAWALAAEHADPDGWHDEAWDEP